MKILYITIGNPFTSNGAGSNRIRGLLENLASNSTIKVVQVNRESSTNKTQAYGEIDFEELDHGYQFLHFLPQRIKDEWLNYFLSKKDRIQLLTRVEEFKPDIVWLDRSMPTQRFLVESGIDSKQIKTFIELSEFLDIHKVQKTAMIRSLIEDAKATFFLKRAVTQYDGIALMTKTLLQHFKDDLVNKNQKLLHLPMTVDFSRFNQLSAAPEEFKSPYIAFVGVMNNIKDGVDILIEAFAKIAKDFPEHTLYLVGPRQPDTLGHLKQIEELGLDDRVFWMKTYPRDIIPAIICNADLLVLPRPDSKQAQGGFPTKLGEYLATGKPVCATRVGEIPDYLTDNESVFFAQPGSVDSFADAMRRALVDRIEAAKIGENGRIVAAREFNAFIQAEKLNAFFEQLIENKKDD